MSRRVQQKSLLFSVDEVVNESIKYLRDNEPEGGYFLAFSGGKDSIVTKELCVLAGVKFKGFYSMTTIDPPELLKFIKKHHSDVVWLRNKKNFYRLVEERMPPLRMARWCCDELKEKPGMETKKAYPVHVTGIRAEESRARSKRPRLDVNHRIPGTVNIKPIFYWSEWHVWEFIDKNEIPYPTLYDDGFDRIGCVICPFLCHKNQAKMDKHKNRWPAMFRAFERSVEVWYKSKKTKDNRHSSVEEYINGWYRGFE